MVGPANLMIVLAWHGSSLVQKAPVYPFGVEKKGGWRSSGVKIHGIEKKVEEKVDKGIQ